MLPATSIPWYSKMLRNIEKLAYKETTEPFRGDGADEGFEPYRFTTEDLHRVMQAVTHCTVLGRPMFPSVQDPGQILSHARSYDYPKTFEDVRALQVAHHRSTQRLLAKQSLVQSRHSSPEEYDDDLEDHPMPDSFEYAATIPDSDVPSEAETGRPRSEAHPTPLPRRVLPRDGSYSPQSGV